jgi:hypothetical protein
MLHHNKTPAHMLLFIHKLLAKHETTLVPQLLYSSEFGPVDFFLSPKLKSTLKGCLYQRIEEIEEISLWDLCAIPQNVFQDAFQNWKNVLSGV